MDFDSRPLVDRLKHEASFAMPRWNWWKRQCTTCSEDKYLTHQENEITHKLTQQDYETISTLTDKYTSRVYTWTKDKRTSSKNFSLNNTWDRDEKGTLPQMMPTLAVLLTWANKASTITNNVYCHWDWTSLFLLEKPLSVTSLLRWRKDSPGYKTR